ncbi:sensor domain-containing diguanylate cyclase [Agarivorans aestuarii]|uniref:sensor domain-containing diguanylate cyclase n=1 Tax=Agarivorans aestuarii TaxID=1563703 RepID=UPI001C803CED|nr:sensor domain-containing diguanylate cyclase [Agarivorans aestuarii]
MGKVSDISAYYGIVIHRDFLPLFADERYAQMFGYDSAEDIMALPSLLELIAEDDRDEAISAYEAVMSGQARPKVRVYENYNRDGEQFSVLTIDHLTEWQGKPALQITLVDFSPQIAAEKKLQQSEQRYRLLTESSLQGIMVHRFFEPLYCNQAMANILGYDSPEAVLKLDSLLSIIPEENQQQAIQLHERLIQGEVESNSVVAENVRRDGTSTWLHISEAVVKWNDKPAVQSVMMDVTQQHHDQRRLEFQANHDPLTGLMNRRSMSVTLTEEFAIGKRSLQPLCCILLDIDNFKQINDRFGHPAGDEALRVFAIESLKVLRNGDYLCRWGGEEFLLLLPNTVQEQALLIANRVRQHLAELEVTKDEHSFSTTVSLGLAMLSSYDASPEALVARADSALYIAKEGGKNRVELAPQVYEL